LRAEEKEGGTAGKRLADIQGEARRKCRKGQETREEGKITNPGGKKRGSQKAWPKICYWNRKKGASWKISSSLLQRKGKGSARAKGKVTKEACF